MKQLILLLLVIIVVSCDNSKEDIENETNRELGLSLNPITVIGVSQVYVSAKINGDSNYSIGKVGFCWSKTANPTISNDTINSKLAIGDFSSIINTLDEKSKYYIKAFAIQNGNTYYSTEIEVKTKSVNVINDITYRFDSEYSEEGISAIGTMDGGLIIAGNISYFYDHLGGDIMLLKYNSNCELLWKKILADPNTNQFVHQIIQDSNGNYLLVSSLFRNKVFEPTVSKFNQSGNLLWEINVDERENDENGTYSAVSITETVEGDYALAGNWNPDRNGPLYPDSNFSFIKISRNGELLIKKNYGLPNHIEHAWTLLENSNKNIILIGTSPGQNNDSNMKLINLDPNGVILWENEYGGYKDDFPKSAISASDGNILIAGYSNSYSNNYKIWLVKMNWDGNYIWESPIGTERAEIYVKGPSAMVEDKNNNLLIAATSSFGVYGDMYAVKASSEGKLVWDKNLNSTENKPSSIEKLKSFDGAYSIIELSNGEIILVGRKEDEENPRFDGTTSDIWLVKIREE